MDQGRKRSERTEGCSVRGSWNPRAGAAIVTEPDQRVFLVIKFGDHSYMGTLLFKDAAFCRHIADLLQAHFGKTMKEIGDLELSYTL